MKSAHESEHSEVSSEPLLQSYSAKYPLLFKWKVATLSLAVISLLLLMATVILIYFVVSASVIIKDSTFLIATKAQILTLYNNLYASNSFIFNFARKVFPSNNSQISQKSLKQAFIQSSSDTLFIFQLKQLEKITKFVIFVDTAFPIPSEFDDEMSYFTFDTQSQSDKKTLIAGISRPFFLKMSQNVQNMSQCEVYRFSKSELNLISLMKVQYDNKVELKFNNSNCFMGRKDPSAFEGQIKGIIGLDSMQNAILAMQIFNLYNQ